MLPIQVVFGAQGYMFAAGLGLREFGNRTKHNKNVCEWQHSKLSIFWLDLTCHRYLQGIISLMMHSSHISVIRSLRVSRSHTGVCVVQAKWSHCTILSQIFLSDLTVKVDTWQSEIHTANKSGCPLVNGEWSLDICYWFGNMWRSCRNLALWA